MAEDIKFIEFEKVPNAPKIAVPADFSQEQINEYLKTEAVESAMFEKGFNFKYGLQPVDMLPRLQFRLCTPSGPLPPARSEVY